MTLNTLDLIIVGAIAISGLFGLYRGFSSSILSLFTWVFALWLPFRFTNEFSMFLPDSIASHNARLIVSACCLFFGAFIILSLICFLLRKLIGVTGLGFADRLFGLFLGLARGVVIVALLALLGTYSSTLTRESFWQESKLMKPVLRVSEVIRAQLPDNLARLFVTSRL